MMPALVNAGQQPEILKCALPFKKSGAGPVVIGGNGLGQPGVQIMLAGLAVVVQLRIAEGRMDEALALLGAVWHHPALGDDARDDVEFWVMPSLRERLAQEEIQAGMEAGRELDLDEVAEAFLAQVG